MIRNGQRELRLGRRHRRRWRGSGAAAASSARGSSTRSATAYAGSRARDPARRPEHRRGIWPSGRTAGAAWSGRRRPQGVPVPGFSLGARVLRHGSGRATARRPWSRGCATTSVRTPTSAPTATAPSTHCGRGTEPSRRSDRHGSIRCVGPCRPPAASPGAGSSGADLHQRLDLGDGGPPFVARAPRRSRPHASRTGAPGRPRATRSARCGPRSSAVASTSSTTARPSASSPAWGSSSSNRRGSRASAIASESRRRWPCDSRPCVTPVDR